MARTVQSDVVPISQVQPVKNTSLGQLANIFAEALSGTANVINQNTALINRDNQDMAAIAKIRQAANDSTVEAQQAGFNVQAYEFHTQTNQNNIDAAKLEQMRADKLQQQEIGGPNPSDFAAPKGNTQPATPGAAAAPDSGGLQPGQMGPPLPVQIEQQRNLNQDMYQRGLFPMLGAMTPENLGQFFKTHPELLPEVQNTARGYIAKNLAAKAAAELQASIADNPRADIDQLWSQIAPKYESQFAGDPVTMDQFKLEAEQNKSILIGQALVQNAKERTQEAHDSVEGDFLSKTALNAQAGTLDNNNWDTLKMQYITDSKKLGDLRSTEDFQVYAIQKLAGMLAGGPGQSIGLTPEQALKTFQNVFPEGSEKNVEDYVAQGLIRDTRIKLQNLYSATLKDIISGAENPHTLQQIKTQVDTLTTQNMLAKDRGQDVELNKAIIDRQRALNSLNGANLDKDMGASLTREAVNNVLSRAESDYKNNQINVADYDQLKSKATTQLLTFQPQSEVDDIINRKPGWQAIPVTEEHYKYIDRWSDGLMQLTVTHGPLGDITTPGLDRATAYQKTVQTFGVLTKNQIDDVNSLALNPSAPAVAEAASVFGKIYQTDPGYMNMLVEKKQISAKARAVFAMNQFFGYRPEDVAVASVGTNPTNFNQAYDIMDTPTKTEYGLYDQTYMIKYALANSGFTGLYGQLGRPSMLFPQTYEAFQASFAFHYASLAAQQPGSDVKALASTARKMAGDDLVKNSQVVDMGGDRIPLIRSPFSGAQLKIISDIWSNGRAFLGQKYDVEAKSLYLDMPNGVLNGDHYDLPIIRTDRLTTGPVGYLSIPADPVKQKTLHKLYDFSNYDVKFNLPTGAPIPIGPPQVTKDSFFNDIFREKK